MATFCAHRSYIRDVLPTSVGCEDCLAADGHDWVHLRLCMSCGHVGCYDASPGRHATAHFVVSGHPIIRSCEPGDDWFWCYVDELFFELEKAPGPVSHPWPSARGYTHPAGSARLASVTSHTRGEHVTLGDTYDVEDIGADRPRARCRHCGRIWNVVDEGSWRCPDESTHDE